MVMKETRTEEEDVDDDYDYDGNEEEARHVAKRPHLAPDPPVPVPVAWEREAMTQLLQEQRGLIGELRAMRSEIAEVRQVQTLHEQYFDSIMPLIGSSGGGGRRSNSNSYSSASSPPSSSPSSSSSRISPSICDRHRHRLGRRKRRDGGRRGGRLHRHRRAFPHNTHVPVPAGQRPSGIERRICLHVGPRVGLSGAART